MINRQNSGASEVQRILFPNNFVSLDRLQEGKRRNADKINGFILLVPERGQMSWNLEFISGNRIVPREVEARR